MNNLACATPIEPAEDNIEQPSSTNRISTFLRLGLGATIIAILASLCAPRSNNLEARTSTPPVTSSVGIPMDQYQHLLLYENGKPAYYILAPKHHVDLVIDYDSNSQPSWKSD